MRFVFDACVSLGLFSVPAASFYMLLVKTSKLLTAAGMLMVLMLQVNQATGSDGGPSNIASAQALSSIPDGLVVVRGDGTSVHFRLSSDLQKCEGEIGFFYVDAPDGSIVCRQAMNPFAPPELDHLGRPSTVRPGQPGYLEVALNDRNSKTLFRAGELYSNAGTVDRVVEIPGDRFIAFYYLQNSSIENWRYAAREDRPAVRTSIEIFTDQASGAFWRKMDAGPWSRVYRLGEASRSAESSTVTGGAQPKTTLHINAVPVLGEDSYTVFPDGQNFDGPPTSVGSALAIESPTAATSNLLENDYGSDGRKLWITHVRVETPGLELPELENGPWLELKHCANGSDLPALIELEDPRLHGRLMVAADGAIQFHPTSDDPYWRIETHLLEPVPVVVDYRATDGVDLAESRIWIGHGYYRRGQPDDRCEGQGLLFLGGGGNGKPFIEGRRRFFRLASQSKDIVILSQGCENMDFANLVFDDFAAGSARSIVSLNLTTRQQANDPRIVAAIRSADTIWLGGGSQAGFYQCWNGTALSTALSSAAASGVSIGATSAGTAILGHAAYVELPGDSINSSFALCKPEHERLQLIGQGAQGFPFVSLSASQTAPLHRVIVDTHFVEANRMGRLATFAAMHRPLPMRGLGIDARTAVLIEPKGEDYRWTVYGNNAAYWIAPSSPVFNSESMAGQPKGTSATGAFVSYSRPNQCSALSCDRVHVLKLRAGTSMLQSDILHAPANYHLFISNGVVYSHQHHGQLY